MNNKIRFTAVATFILGTRAYDAYSTALYTPDLSMEANPLVSQLGMGWTSLLLTIGLLTLGSLYAYHRALFSNHSIEPSEKGMSFKQYATYVYLGHTDQWSAFMYKFPKSLKRFTHFMGHYFIPALSFAGVVSTLMWLGIKYTSFYPPIHSLTLVYSILVGGAILVSGQKMYKNYAAYKARV
ncbi:MAG: hypothetical protein SchgKO_02360 [Schleiferiaceae bacterium]